jgi:hypothetical protein
MPEVAQKAPRKNMMLMTERNKQNIFANIADSTVLQYQVL